MKFLLYDHSGCLNRGCEAIVRSTSGILRRAFPGCEIGLCSYSPSEDIVLSDIPSLTVHGVAQKNLSGIGRCINAFNYKLLHSSSYFYKASYADTVRFARDYDICLLIGGDTFCYGNNELSRNLTRLFKAAGKRVVAWGCSIGAEDLTPEKIETLKTFDAIFARESLTAAVLQSEGIGNVYVFPDPAFTLEKELLPLPEGWGEHMVGINISPLVARRCDKLGNYAVALLKYIENSTAFTPLLVPHVTLRSNNDYEFLKKIKEVADSKKSVLLPDSLTAAQYKGYISRTEMFLGARTHSIIGAYSSGVPAFALGYSIKARGIAKDLFGSEKCVRGVESIQDAADLISCFDELCESREAMAEILQSNIQGVIQKSFSAAEKLKSI